MQHLSYGHVRKYSQRPDNNILFFSNVLPGFHWLRKAVLFKISTSNWDVGIYGHVRAKIWILTTAECIWRVQSSRMWRRVVVWKSTDVPEEQVASACSSETSVDFQQTTWRYIPQDRTLHIQRCENLHIFLFITHLCFWRKPLQKEIRCFAWMLLAIVSGLSADPGRPWVHHEGLRTSALVLELSALARRWVNSNTLTQSCSLPHAWHTNLSAFHSYEVQVKVKIRLSLCLIS
jgi:hypothetical protein